MKSDTDFMNTSPTMFKTMRKRNIWKSINWMGNFQYMCSKDNQHYPRNFREYFDTPRQYDVNGSRKYLKTSI